MTRLTRESERAWAERLRSSAPDASFTQYPAHAAGKVATGWRAVVVVADGAAGGTCTSWTGGQFLLRKLPGLLGTIAYLPRGPITVAVGEDGAAQTRAAFCAGLAPVLRAEEVSLVRIELGDHAVIPDGVDEVAPPASCTAELAAPWLSALRAAGLTPHNAGFVQPRSSRVIDVRQGTAAVRAAWHANRRRYVRQAEGAGVRVRIGGEADAEALHLVLGSVAARKGTRVRSTAMFAGILRAYGDQAEAAIAEGAQGQLLGALLLVRTPTTMTVSFGGATGEGNRLRATASLQAHAFDRAIALGCAKYDLWGLPTPGIAYTKRDWGGQAIAYAGAIDIDLDPVRGPLARLALRLRGFGG